MKRRHFLHAGLFATGAIATLGTHALIARAAVPASQPKRLIVIFLRGAVDGLSVVVPYQETAYYEMRPRIAIPKPGAKDGAIALDSRFGLHPALAMLMPLWQQKSLAFVHASGSPDPTRSHFEAQDYMESGTTSRNRTADGWMNRLLGAIADHNPIQAINVGATTPHILEGKMAVASLAAGRGAGRPLPIDRPLVGAAFDRLYQGNGALGQTYREGREARQALLSDLDAEMQMANNAAPLPAGFASDAKRLARVMVKDPRVELAFMALGGWDTHVNQGSSQGALARNLNQLGQGLATLQQSLGSVYQDTTILVMSEFGRTVHENGNGGTDHGHGNVMWLLGGSVRGGQVYGNWPGLASNQLYEGRDLAVITDFRDVIASVLQRHLHLADAKLHQVFAGYTPSQTVAVV